MPTATHVGPPPPATPLRDLTHIERCYYQGHGYVAYEEATKRFWTERELYKKCGQTVEVPGDPGPTLYCPLCQAHFLLREFAYLDGRRVGV